ncbi:MAG TPA: hypothetical protein DEF48_21085 [Nostoc sp. UBA8866]|uniref:Uncharacterized protein n=1 Tax=Trichormus variabilis NIES-23 TaxID=1973479 RepID=A0A1Z4KRA8_ANAVA|nr:hypothetical protein NIES23_42900 [Trichormus variabilis NIES-23]HBW32517.1 hypothetical protein [Nostoc sp. UBA8866]
MWFDPPKSPLKRVTLILVPPFLRGVRGDQNDVGQGYKTCVYTVASQGRGLERGFWVYILTFQTTS